jgi:hypothetical protein
LIKVGIFIWAIKTQGLEPDADCFCNIHELSYQTKANGNVQYHNNSGCYTFVYRSDIRYPMPTLRKKMVGFMDEAMVLRENDLNERTHVKDVIKWPFGRASG